MDPKRIWNDPVASKVIATLATDLLKQSWTLFVIPAYFALAGHFQWKIPDHPWLWTALVDLLILAFAVYLVWRKRPEAETAPPPANSQPAEANAAAASHGAQSPAVAIREVHSGATVTQHFHYGTASDQGSSGLDDIALVRSKFHELLRLEVQSKGTRVAIDDADAARVRYEYRLGTDLNEYLKNLHETAVRVRLARNYLRDPNVIHAPPVELPVDPRQTLSAGHQLFLNALNGGLSARFAPLLQQGQNPASSNTALGEGSNPITEHGERFQYSGFRQSLIALSPYANIGATKIGESTNNEETEEALIFYFEIRQNGPASSSDVVAKLTFRTADRNRSQTVNYGVWLDSPTNSKHLACGDTGELVICFIGNRLLAPDDRRARDHQYHEPGVWLDRRNISGMRRMEVRLTDRRDGKSQTFEFEIWRDGGMFCVQ